MCCAPAGGKIEGRDGSPEATAAREAEEESHRALSQEEVLPLLSPGHAVWLKQCKYVLYLAHVPEDQTTDLPKICRDNVAGEEFMLGEETSHAGLRLSESLH